MLSLLFKILQGSQASGTSVKPSVGASKGLSHHTVLLRMGFKETPFLNLATLVLCVLEGAA